MPVDRCGDAGSAKPRVAETVIAPFTESDSPVEDYFDWIAFAIQLLPRLREHVLGMEADISSADDMRDLVEWARDIEGVAQATIVADEVVAERIEARERTQQYSSEIEKRIVQLAATVVTPEHPGRGPKPVAYAAIVEGMLLQVSRGLSARDMVRELGSIHHNTLLRAFSSVDFRFILHWLLDSVGGPCEVPDYQSVFRTQSARETESVCKQILFRLQKEGEAKEQS